MVCPYEAGSTSCTVHDTTPCSTIKKISFVVRPTNAVNEIFSYVATQFPYKSFELALQSSGQDQAIFLNDKKEKNLYEIPGFVAGTKNTLVLMPPGSWEINPKKRIDLDTALSPTTPDPDPMSDDDLALGASASPTEPDSTTNIPVAPALPMFDQIESQGTYNKLRFYSSTPRTALGYVGLVNQAMTCYLNSLLQALFMTPEFRNALYKRKFDNVDEAKCIPYQLQKLFLNLQTSSKGAVETTDLTRSFGWDSTEAWQQHDIQELCRVMFDALECKFKGTDQENLINSLYEGKMIDYVKCLECETEKSREDTYLDIPLPVRPFGSTSAYGSIEEALRAFVQPEILDENNQYFCEKCNKKCDAHKGLKFKNFPYILTLHLKRFDFDYQTLHRIKLNDKVTFPQTLNLNSFVNTTDAGTFANLQNNNHSHMNGFANSHTEHENAENSGVKYDDCSTTDSGAALEEDNCSGIATTASSSHHENELQEDDEGIDMSNSAHPSNESGPYIYELFAIMIHSGSASGGHYYAYIKEFENGEWYCFNDQTVTSITQEDIQKSFGGGSFKAYYSGAYSSSTNAYMLMYRQLDSRRNEKAMKTDDFPEYIQKLLQDMHEKEQEDKKRRTSESGIINPRVYFYNPKLRQIKDAKVYISKTFPLESALETAYGRLDVQKFAPLSRCRLVAYDYQNEEIVMSLEGREQEPIGDVCHSLYPESEFLLEIRGENEEFERYEPGGITMKVYKVDLKTIDIDGPRMIRFPEQDTVDNVKNLLARKLGFKHKDMVIATFTISTGVLIVKEGPYKSHARMRVFVACTSNPTDETGENLRRIVKDNFVYLIHLYVSVQRTDKDALEILGIPKYEPRERELVHANFQTPKQSPSEQKLCESISSDVVDAVVVNGTVNGDAGACGDFKRASPLPMISVCTGHESNSEDSSLSDGDRTLVESTHHDSSQISSTSHSPQLSSPEDENGLKHGCSEDEENIELDSGLYFRVCDIENEDLNGVANGSLSDSEDNKETVDKQRTLKVYVDKRMTLRALKRALEPTIGVPVEYFKIVRTATHQPKLVGDKNESMVLFADGEHVMVELGRNLKKGECKAKINYLKLNELSNETGKLPQICEWIFKVDMLVSDAKKELIAQLHKIDPKYHSLNLQNCRLWEKSLKNPVKILPDEEQIGTEIRVSANCELIVQECEEGANMTIDEENLTLFVRKWHPSTLELGPFQEITLEKNSDIKKVLSSLSGIPEDKVAFTRVSSSFPCTEIKLLVINSSMKWFTKPTTVEEFPLCNSKSGNVYFYKSSAEPPKDLTPEERRELNQKEDARIERVGGASTSLYSPRKERGLKIYLEK